MKSQVLSSVFVWLVLVTLGPTIYFLWMTASDDEVRTSSPEERQFQDPPTIAADVAVAVGRSQPSAGVPKYIRRHRFHRAIDAPQPRRRVSLYYNQQTVPKEFKKWSASVEQICSGRLVGYAQEFVLLKNVLVDRTHCHCQRHGGEPVNALFNQEESIEYCKLDNGCFQLPCVDFRLYNFNYESTHLNTWMDALKTGGDISDVDGYQFDEFTIAVQRYEYVNLYHTMTDWYNAFLVMEFFGRTPQKTHILIIDGHPYGSLDTVWPQLFNSSFRLSALPSKTRFRRMVWNIVGYHSPMKVYLSPYPPLFDEFRSFFLSSYDIDADRQINCDNLTVLFIWRRDYVAHPRNPTGFIQRKIDNEAKLIQYVRKQIPDIGVSGVQIDGLSMHNQLRLVTNTDILVGVHGAGLTHAVFLPRGAGLLELVPNAVWADNQHFETIASWRALVYQRWINNDLMLDNEPRGMLTVPPRFVAASIHSIRKRMCSTTSTDQNV